jgi:prevent-host-death family protein
MEATMIDITKDIQPLTTFRNNSVKMMQRLKKTRRPIILTVNGKPEAVVQDAAAYQRLLDLAAKADPEEGLRQGLEDIAKGRTRPARQVFAKLREEYGIRG